MGTLRVVRRIAVSLLLATALSPAGCKKKETEDPIEANKRHKPDAADAECSGSCNDANSCYASGYKHLYPDGGDGNEEGAAPCFRRACELGNADACRGLAGMFDFGNTLGPNEKRAAEFWARAVKLHRDRCDGGEMRDCFELGILMFRGQGIAKDEPEATKLYKQACNGGNANGCVELKLVCTGNTAYPACF